MEYCIFAAGESGGPDALIFSASIVLGLAIAWFLSVLLAMATRPSPETAAAWEFEGSRLVQLRSASRTYRWFSPLVDELAELNRRWRPRREFSLVQRQLNQVRGYPPWKPEELLAVHQMLGLLVGLVAAIFGLFVGGSLLLAVIGGSIGFWGYVWLLRRQLADIARERVHAFKRRLPFAVDLMALMMEAGASFLESLKTVVTENRGNVLAEEFGNVLVRIEAGQGRKEALEQLESRLKDDDVSELVFAINKGEELGTPLSQILCRQAEQMRLKRFQWAEKAVGEAQVNISFPGFVIMIACMLIATAPFILAAIY